MSVISFLSSATFADAGDILGLSVSLFLAEALASRLIREEWALVAKVATQKKRSRKENRIKAK